MRFLFEFGSCYRSTEVVVPPCSRQHEDTVGNNNQASGGHGKQQNYRLTGSKSESAVHWRPALSVISEDSVSQFAENNNGRKLDKKGSCKGRIMAKSHSYHATDGFRVNSMPMMPAFLPAPFMF